MKKKYLFQNKRLMIYYLLLCFVCFLVFVFGYIFTFYLNYDYEVYYPTIYTFLFSVFGIFFGIVFLYIVYLLGKYYQKLYEEFHFQVQDSFLKDESLSHKIFYKLKSKYYHDLFEQLRKMNETQLNQKGDFVNLESIINQYKNEFSQNMIINTIMSYKLNLPENSQISVENHIHLSTQTFVSDIDLSSLFFNLLDNALNATRCSSQPSLIINIDEKYNCLRIQIQNTYDKNHITQNKKGHGYGLRIIQDIVNTYQGEMIIQKDDMFCVTVYLYQEESL